MNILEAVYKRGVSNNTPKDINRYLVDYQFLTQQRGKIRKLINKKIEKKS